MDTMLREDRPIEFQVGTEDRVFKGVDGKWYWQARGTSALCGPFRTIREAQADYKAT